MAPKMPNASSPRRSAPLGSPRSGARSWQLATGTGQRAPDVNGDATGTSDRGSGTGAGAGRALALVAVAGSGHRTSTGMRQAPLTARQALAPARVAGTG